MQEKRNRDFCELVQEAAREVQYFVNLDDTCNSMPERSRALVPDGEKLPWLNWKELPRLSLGGRCWQEPTVKDAAWMIPDVLNKVFKIFRDVTSKRFAPVPIPTILVCSD